MPQRRSLAEDSLALFVDAGYRRVEPAILQPASIFLDLSGEDIGRRMFVTADADGTELTLRPEYTIPVARAVLADAVPMPAAVAYCGPVFRLRSSASGASEPSEFVQAGIESFGRADREAAEAEILGLALEAVAAAGVPKVEARLGDVGLFSALLDALKLTQLAARRLRRGFAQGALSATLERLGQPRGESAHAGVLRALEGQDPQAARAFVQDLLRIAGIPPIGGRSPGEIAERFLEQAGAEAQSALTPEAASVLRRYCAVSADPDSAAAAIRDIAAEAGLDLAQALDLFETRNGFMAARGIDLATLRFEAGFGRNLDYYTGFVFELRAPGRSDLKPLVGGGRYDRLLQMLGADAPAPAIGCAIWIDRLFEATQ